MNIGTWGNLLLPSKLTQTQKKRNFREEKPKNGVVYEHDFISLIKVKS
jgi:hypothetical protein